MKVYTINEAAAIFKVRRETIYDWINKGRLKYIEMPSGKKRIPESEIKKFTEIKQGE